MQTHIFCVIWDFDSQFFFLPGTSSIDALERYFRESGSDTVFGNDREVDFNNDPKAFALWVHAVIDDPARELQIHYTVQP